jgi:hypothetical protein
LVVTFYIFTELFFPEFSAAFGLICELTAGMPMPEATMDENRSLVFGQDNVRLSGKVFLVQSEPATQAV